MHPKLSIQKQHRNTVRKLRVPMSNNLQIRSHQSYLKNQNNHEASSCLDIPQEPSLTISASSYHPLIVKTPIQIGQLNMTMPLDKPWEHLNSDENLCDIQMPYHKRHSRNYSKPYNTVNEANMCPIETVTFGPNQPKK